MLRKATALAAALAVSVGLGACTDASGTTSPTSIPSGRDRTPPPPIVSGPGAADIGMKWNWNLQAPLAFAEQVGWGDTFLEVEWCDLKDSPGERRFAQLERLLGRATELGYRMMLKIRVGACHGEGEAVDPAEGTRKKPSGLPDDKVAYQEFVRNLVTRYKDRGVTTWAIENEVDAANFWSGSGADYVETVRLATEAIKEADPQATILDAGISSTGYGVAMAGEFMDAGREQDALAVYQGYYERRLGAGNSRFPRANSVEELRGILASGRAVKVREMVAANWEAVNAGGITAYQLHFYEKPQMLPALLQYIDNHLIADIPIQAWEVGTAWPGPTYSERAHAAEVAQLLGMLFAARMSPVVYLPLAFTPGGPDKAEIFRGLVAPDGRPLLPAQVYARYAAAARSSTAVDALTLDQGSGVLFTGPGSSFAVVWPESGTTLTVESGSVARASVADDPGQAAPAGAVSTPLLVDLDTGETDESVEELGRLLGQDVTLSE